MRTLIEWRICPSSNTSKTKWEVLSNLNSNKLIQAMGISSPNGQLPHHHNKSHLQFKIEILRRQISSKKEQILYLRNSNVRKHVKSIMNLLIQSDSTRQSRTTKRLDRLKLHAD
jgi:hypothetical protein